MKNVRNLKIATLIKTKSRRKDEHQVGATSIKWYHEKHQDGHHGY